MSDIKVNGYSYREFVRYFQETDTNLDRLLNEEFTYKEKFKIVPLELQKEIKRHELMIDILVELSEEKYKKSYEELVTETIKRHIIE